MIDFLQRGFLWCWSHSLRALVSQYLGSLRGNPRGEGSGMCDTCKKAHLRVFTQFKVRERTCHSKQQNVCGQVRELSIRSRGRSHQGRTSRLPWKWELETSWSSAGSRSSQLGSTILLWTYCETIPMDAEEYLLSAKIWNSTSIELRTYRRPCGQI